MRSRIGRRGFTLVEMLVTVTIIAILAGLAQGVMGAASETEGTPPEDVRKALDAIEAARNAALAELKKDIASIRASLKAAHRKRDRREVAKLNGWLKGRREELKELERGKKQVIPELRAPLEKGRIGFLPWPFRIKEITGSRSAIVTTRILTPGVARPVPRATAAPGAISGARAGSAEAYAAIMRAQTAAESPGLVWKETDLWLDDWPTAGLVDGQTVDIVEPLEITGTKQEDSRRSRRRTIHSGRVLRINDWLRQQGRAVPDPSVLK